MLPRVSLLLAVSLLCLLFAGCAGTQGVPLEPLPTGGGSTELRLGPDVVAMSEGPGYKSSPAWSADGDDLAFVMDGYAVSTPTVGVGQRRWTERNFGAQAVGWNTDGSLSVTLRPGMDESGQNGSNDQAGEDESSEEVKTSSIYRASGPLGSASGSAGGPGEASEVAENVIVSASTNGKSSYGSIIATRRGSESLISVLLEGVITRTYSQAISGLVTGISISPSGTRAVLAVKTSDPDERSRYELRTIDLVEGDSTSLVELSPGRYISGSPQWSPEGIYYLAGDERQSPISPEETRAVTYTATQRLYLLEDGSNGPVSRPAPGPGSDFTASNIRLSPDGSELAIIGRLSSDSATNVYNLNLQNSELLPLTENEDMEIKSGSEDLAWSPGGDHLAIVARGTPPVGLRVYPAPASTLLEAFYNIYRVPVQR